jgi:hypothetical protein
VYGVRGARKGYGSHTTGPMVWINLSGGGCHAGGSVVLRVLENGVGCDHEVYDRQTDAIQQNDQRWVDGGVPCVALSKGLGIHG